MFPLSCAAAHMTAYDEENAAQQFPTAAQWFLMSQHDDHLMEIKPLDFGLDSGDLM